MQRTRLLLCGCLTACAATANGKAPPAAAEATSATAISASCKDPERRAMDFWIGDWDLSVETPKGAQEWQRSRGVNEIRSVLGGCAIEERFHADGPDAPWAGRSFSVYVPAKGLWRQTWVDDSGAYLAFEGGPTKDSFTLVGEEKIVAGARTRMRMVFREITRDSIVWSWERGTIPETTWEPTMVIRYTRRAAR